MSKHSMRAMVLEENGVLVAESVPMPEAGGPEDYLIRVRATGVCGSDLPRAFASGAHRYPLIMGHEISGVVEEARAGGRFAEGDHVVAFPLLPCRRCPACSIGAYAQCSDYDYYGSRRDGGFAEFVSVPEANLFPVPTHLDLAAAALTEPAAVALHAVGKLTVEPGASAAVFGGGPIGLLAAHWLSISGCDAVYVVEVDPEKLAAASLMGFETVDARNADPVAAIRAAVRAAAGATMSTAARGARSDAADTTDRSAGVGYAVEACGLPVTYRQALAAVDTFGEVVLLGNLKGAVTLDSGEVSSILRRELKIHGTWNSSIVPPGCDEWSRALSYMGRVFDVEPLISHRVSIEEAPDMLGRMYRGELSYMRVLVEPGR